jgi:hypothetical protein
MKRGYLKFTVAASVFFTASALALLAGCSNPAGSSDADRPDAAEVKTVYDAVNDTANYLCSYDVNTTLASAGQTTFYYSDTAGFKAMAIYTLKVEVNTTGATGYPFTVVYSFYGYNPNGTNSYTVTGSQTAVITSSGWTATGSLTGTGSDITSMTTDMSNDGTTTTGTLVVNGYPYDYAAAAYK